jgi:hypothetical protein
VRRARPAARPCLLPGKTSVARAETGRNDRESGRAARDAAQSSFRDGRPQMSLRKSWVTAFLGCLIVAFATTAAAAKPKVHADYDKTTNFAAFKTFGFVSPPGTQVAGYPAEITSAIEASVKRELAARGYTYTDSKPDLLVNFSANLKPSQKNDELANQTLGYYGYRQGVRVPVYKTWSTYAYADDTKDYILGTLNIELVDAAHSQMVWEGVAVGEVKNPDKPIDQLAPAIDKVVK